MTTNRGTSALRSRAVAARVGRREWWVSFLLFAALGAGWAIALPSLISVQAGGVYLSPPLGPLPITLGFGLVLIIWHLWLLGPSPEDLHVEVETS